MKVFSKGSKNKSNKSTPILSTNQNQPRSSPKLKITTFRQILSQNSVRDQKKSDERKGVSQNADNSNTMVHSASQLIDRKKKNQKNNNKTPLMTSVQFINSFEIKGAKTQRDSSSSKSSKEEFNILAYGAKATLQKIFGQQQVKDKKNLLQFGLASGRIKTADQSQPQWQYKEPIQFLTQQHPLKIYSSNLIQKVSEPKALSLSDFRVGRRLGRGRFGNVYVAQQKKTGMVVGLKAVGVKQVREESMENQLAQEIKLQNYMSHPNVLGLYGCFREGDYVYLILEYADEGCLFRKVNQKMEQRMAAYYARQALTAIKYLHSQNILHRDIKPENILLCQGVAKLADFGWAAYAPKHKRVTFCGTLDYVPPQILRGDYYHSKVDLWSLGVLLYELATGHAPFQNPMTAPADCQARTVERILSGDLIVPLTLSPDLRRLILSLLQTEPQNRLNLDEVQRSEWMRRHRQEGTEINRQIWIFWGKITQ